MDKIRVVGTPLGYISRMITRPGIVYYTCKRDDGSFVIQQASFLFGSIVHGIFGNNHSDSVVALTQDGIYDLSTGLLIVDKEFVKFTCGYNHCVGSTRSGELYTWGEGRYGELGLGSRTVIASSPLQIPIDSNIIEISTGDYYTVAQDSKGNVFVWGQNFDKQLGLYMKMSKDMPNDCIIEEMCYAPRLLPLCLKEHIKSISCGPNFTIATTQSGDVFSWGAGECGQLGTGRCTNRDIPTRIDFVSNVNAKENIIDIACGIGHVLAVSSTGSIYSWGLNKHGQLGLGDTNTRFSPCIIHNFDICNHSDSVCELLSCKLVRADGYSSAAIDSDGKLFTWGSTLNDRLMLNREKVNGRSYIALPTLVTSFIGNEVNDFAFSKLSSAILIHSRLLELSPNMGPQKSMGDMEISGCGFYEGMSIIVKFTSKNPNSSRMAPRSCLGKYISPTLIKCKPPKLGDYGEFGVSVSLDGKTFIPDELMLNVYKDFSIVDVSPKIVDKRLVERNIVPVRLICKHLVLDPGTVVQVKFSVSIYEGSSLENTAKCIEVTLPGTILKPEDTFIAPLTPSEHDHHDFDVSTVPSQDINGNGNAGPIDVDNKTVACDFDLEIATVLDDDGSIASALDTSLVIIQAQISGNNQDYCPITNRSSSILCHCFDPVHASPSCCPLDSNIGNQTTQILGSSFIPSIYLPKGMELYATMKVQELSKDVVFTDTIADIPIALPWEGVLAVKSESFSQASIKSIDLVKQIELYLQLLNNAMGFDAIEEEEEYNTPRRRVLSDVKVLFITLKFYAKYRAKYRSAASTSPFITEELSSQGLSITLYNPPSFTVSPRAWHTESDKSLTVSIVTTDKLPFQSSSAKVVFRSHRSHLDEAIVAVMENVLFEELDQTTEENKCEEPTDSKHHDVVDDLSVHESNHSPDNVLQKPRYYQASFVRPSMKELLSTASLVSFSPDTFDSQSILPSVETILKEGVVYLDLQLDGRTPQSETTMCQVNLYKKITAEAPIVPKGGAPLKSKLTAPVSGFVEGIPKDQCVIRIRGAADKEISVSGELEYTGSEGTITFNVPDAAGMNGIKPDSKGKDKKYYIDISVDGGKTFDRAEVPLLQLKT